MSLVPIAIPPGISRNGTEYESAGRWYSADLVRFFEGEKRPIRGWQKVADDAIAGVPRAMLAWKDNTGDRWIGLGTTEKLCAYQTGSVVDITPIGFTAGAEDAVSVDGYGAGAFGAGAYQGPRVLPEVTPASTWSLDTWGEFLVACMSSDGKLYEWQVNAGVVAQLIDNAPVDCQGCFVTPERHLVAYGAGGNPRLIQWSDSEDNTVWADEQTNTAGSKEVQTNGTIVTAIKYRGETILFTEVDTHTMRFIGGIFVYSIDKLSKASGIAGPNAGIAIDRGILWMGVNGFFSYDGAVNPLPCEVQDYVFSDINLTQLSKVHAGHNVAFGEVWWWYPSGESNEIDRYVIYNYREDHWMIGSSLSRTCWEDAGVFDYPIAMDAAGFIYQQESGWTADGTSIGSARTIRSGPIEISPGNRVMHVRQIIPDEKTQGQATLTLHAKFTPEDSYVAFGPFTLTPYTDVRLTGRQVSLEIKGVADEDWRVGSIRLDVTPGGRR